MSEGRISLSNAGMRGRVRKYDTYQHDTRRSIRPSFDMRPTSRQIASHAPVTLRQASQTLPAPLSKTSRTQVIPKPQIIQQSSAVPTRNLALHVVANTPARHSARLADEFEEVSLLKRIFRGQLTRGQKAFYGLGLAVFFFAAVVSVHTLVSNSQARNQMGVLGTQTTDEQGVGEGTGDKPSEDKVTAEALANYVVAPELPRYLRIPDIGVFARIKHTGVTSSGAVDAPANIYDVSWFNESAKPGNAIGSSLLLGHVQGWTAPGVFKNIDKLTSGSRFEVEKGNGEKLTYEVIRGEQIPVDKIDMARILSSETPGEHDLKLMTCSGRFDSSTDQYLDRYVVYARIIR